MQALRFRLSQGYRCTFASCALVLAAVGCIGCAGHAAPPREKLSDALEAMEGDVARHVPDPQRAARLQRAIDGLDADLGEFQDVVDKVRVDLKALNARTDATRPDFARLLDEFDARRRAIRDRVLQRHAELIAA